MSKSLRTSYAALRDRFGPAGLVLSVLAIVLALGGGAYAASGGGSHATASKAKALTKAQVLALIKANSKPGPAGPAGANGTNGTNGAPGGSGPEGKQGPKGEQGNPAEYPKTLPSHQTETGTWAISGLFYTHDAEVVEEAFETTITFPIPLSPVISEEEEVGIKYGQARYVTPSQAMAGGNGEGCTGNDKHPTAAPGWLCVYGENEFPTGIQRQKTWGPGEPEGAYPWGARISVTAPESLPNEIKKLDVFGTWAVTAE